MRASAALPLPLEQPADVTMAAIAARRICAHAQELRLALHADNARLSAGWTGLAASAAGAELYAVRRQLAVTADALEPAALLLDDYRHAVELAAHDVVRLRCEADLGTVDGSARSVSRHERILGTLSVAAARVGSGLAQLAERVVGGHPDVVASSTWAESGVLQALPLLASRRAALSGGPHRAPRATALPTQARAWWTLLTPAERARFVWTAPRRIGGLGGIPAADRSRANELVLTRMLSRLTRAPDQSMREPGHPHELLASCRAVQRALMAVRHTVDPVTGVSSVAELLVFRPGAFGGEGRAVVSVGEVDSADDVAVLVPGVGTTVSATLAPLSTAAAGIQAGARVLAPADGEATLAWVGYDAPGFPALLHDGAAGRGARRLSRDLAGLAATHAAGWHLTLVGHSYGSLVVGRELRDHHPAADVVLLGSPGAGVEHADDLRVPRGHVFVGAASRDPVSYLGWFGPDPASQDFGAVRFRAEDLTRNPHRLALADHSKYFGAGSESVANIARVVVGQDGVSRAPYRGPMPWLLTSVPTDPEWVRRPTALPSVGFRP